MAHEASNGREISRARVREPDPHGQAALLLVESLIHGLIANTALNVEEAVEIIGVATEVKTEIAAEWGDSPETMQKSLTLLKAISESLMQDLPHR
jgi:hypothetical protein